MPIQTDVKLSIALTDVIEHRDERRKEKLCGRGRFLKGIVLCQGLALRSTTGLDFLENYYQRAFTGVRGQSRDPLAERECFSLSPSFFFYFGGGTTMRTLDCCALLFSFNTGTLSNLLSLRCEWNDWFNFFWLSFSSAIFFSFFSAILFYIHVIRKICNWKEREKSSSKTPTE